MSELATVAVLREISRLGEAGEPLEPGLRASGLPGADQLADRLASGASLPDAMRSSLGDQLAAWLATTRPPPPVTALVVADELELRGVRRRCLMDSLLYPLLCLLTLVGVAFWLIIEHAISIEPMWWGVAAALVGLPAVIIFIPKPATWPGWLDWRRHAALAGRYARAAIAARWRLPEADCVPLFGESIKAVAPYLGRADAEQTCNNLSAYHRRSALRQAKAVGLVLVVVLNVAAGIIAAAAATGVWTQMTDEMQQTNEAMWHPDGSYLP